MPRKGMRSLFFSPKLTPTSPSSSSSSNNNNFSSPSRFGFSPSRPSFSESVMGRTLDMFEPLILKWDPGTTDFGRVTSLFYESRREARDFLKAVKNLHRAMQILATENPSSENMVRAQNLMQIAMKRLQKEFYQILSVNRAHLDPESVSTRSSRTSTASTTSLDEDDDDDDDDVRAAKDSISEMEDVSTLAMTDLRLIAECMISTGYAKECLEIYKIIRKSIVDEAIYRLGVEKFSSSQIHKMDWEALDLRIVNWLNAVRSAVNTLFNGERILCDYVFASSDSIRESCFTEITKDAAVILFGFPENVTKNTKKTPEKIFRALDMYTAIADNWQEIESIFSFESTAVVKSQALTSFAKLGEFVRAALSEFESVIFKDSSKSPVAGAGIHDLTIDAMKYLSILSDYSNVLEYIFADEPPPSRKNQLPASYFEFSDVEESPAPAISRKMAWIMLVLLCKLDTKGNYYKDVSLAYLFLANNIQYVVVTVRRSNLKYILGDDWLKKHEARVKKFAASYERLGWSHVIETLPSDAAAVESPEEVREIFRKFNASFEQAHKKQSVCVVQDNKLRDDIKISLARKLIGLYREFYNVHRPTMVKDRNSVTLVRYAPEDVGHHLSDLFFGNSEWGSFSSFESSRSPSMPKSR